MSPAKTGLVIFGLILASACLRQNRENSSKDAISGYALIFREKPIIMYPSYSASDAIMVHVDREGLPAVLRPAYDGVGDKGCVVSLFKLSVSTVRAPVGSARDRKAVRIDSVKTATEAERNDFINKVHSAVLDEKSVCYTNTSS